MNSINRATQELECLQMLLDILTRGNRITAITPGEPIVTHDTYDGSKLMLTNLFIDLPGSKEWSIITKKKEENNNGINEAHVQS